MGLAEGIRKLGFRKWYERELAQSHAHLVLLVLCTIGLLGGFEVLGRGTPLADQAGDLAAIVACAAIGVWALRRYLWLLSHAEHAADQAVCAQCQAYGRLDLLRVDAARGRIVVRSKRCGHGWPIED